MTIVLDVIAVCRAPEDDGIPAPAPEPEPEPPAVMPTSSGVYLIHVAPSPRLDPSAKDLDNVEIADDEELADEHLKKFVVD